MTTDAVAKELFDRCKTIDGEVRLLREDKRALFQEYRDRVSPKVFNTALRIAKMKARLTPSQCTDAEAIASLLSNELTVEHVD